MEKNKLRDLWEVKNRPLLLDGAIGSLLQNKGAIGLPSYLWTSGIVLTNRESIREIHLQYLQAGANIITTNTFRLGNTNSTLDTKLIQQIISTEMTILNELKPDFTFLIAGSNGPAEDCYQKVRKISHSQLMEKHKRVIDTLWESGVDFVLNETLSHFDEILFTSQYCFENNIEYVPSIYLDGTGRLLSGEPITEILEEILKYQPAAISVNCISLSTFSKIYESLTNFESPFGFYLNCGLSDINSSVISDVLSPQTYSDFVKYYLQYNPVFIGSCCGSNPEHTKKMRILLDELY